MKTIIKNHARDKQFYKITKLSKARNDDSQIEKWVEDNGLGRGRRWIGDILAKKLFDGGRCWNVDLLAKKLFDGGEKLHLPLGILFQAETNRSLSDWLMLCL